MPRNRSGTSGWHASGKLGRVVTHGHDDEELAAFWAEHGFTLQNVESELRFESREDLEVVILNELGEALAKEVLDDHKGLSVDCVYQLIWRKY